MPELPEVEVTRLGISRFVVDNTVAGVAVHSGKLRALVPPDLDRLMTGQTIRALERRGKYLVLRCASGSLLLHLGMTGHLRIVPRDREPGKHDHFDLHFQSGHTLRLNDVRRFGSLHWTVEEPLHHPLLSGIGPEPLTESFTASYLFQRSRGRSVAIQRFLMDASVVAGVGNIYAAETLFRCGMLPTVPAGSLSLPDCERLVAAVKTVLTTSIGVGSSMDFSLHTEKLAYFPQELTAYDREGEPCRRCGTPIVRGRLGTRSTFYCVSCQH